MKSPPVEQELKMVIETREDFEKLHRILSPPLHSEKQLNIYFDSSDQLLQTHKKMLRVRLTADGALLTLKFRLQETLHSKMVDKGLFRNYEIEANMDTPLWDEIRTGALNLTQINLPPITHLHECLSLPPLSPCGAIWNHRTSYPFPFQGQALQETPLQLELDETHFLPSHREFLEFSPATKREAEKIPPLRIDYEIETETDHPEISAPQLHIFLKTHDIAYHCQKMSKYERLLSIKAVYINA